MNRTTEKNNIVVFWPNDDWGQYGRTYEKVTEHLARLDEVKRVVCIFPPIVRKRYALVRPLSIRRVASNLWLLNENRLRQGGSDRSECLRSRIRSGWTGIVLRTFLRILGYNKENTILWLFPPHPYLEELMEIVPHSLVVTQLVDNFTKIDPSFWLYEFARDQ